MDTEYLSLSEIDPEVVRFYSEETRTRLVGYDEVLEESLFEDYTVVVLNKPPLIEYSDVAKRKGERKGWEVQKAELARAVLWEDFHVNHDQYLAWKGDYNTWLEEQPTEIVGYLSEDEPISEVIPAPVRPQIDMAKRRSYYKETITEFDSELKEVSGTNISYDDTEFVTSISLLLVDKADKEDVLSAREREWRDSKLEYIDKEVNKCEDNGQDAGVWRRYRQALRDYPQQPDFPNGTRPVPENYNE